MKYLYLVSGLMLTPLLPATELLFQHNTYQRLNELSFMQRFELQYLKENLSRYHDQVLQYWILDKNVRILIEMTELAVQESSPTTQQEIKQKIIEIFQTFNIYVYFTADDFIQKLNSPINMHQNLSLKKLKNQLTHQHRKPFMVDSSTQQEKPAKIHGANRTRKKLERARKEREKKAKNDILIEKRKQDFFKKTTLSKHEEILHDPALDQILQAKKEFMIKTMKTKNSQNEPISRETEEIHE